MPGDHPFPRAPVNDRVGAKTGVLGTSEGERRVFPEMCDACDAAQSRRSPASTWLIIRWCGDALWRDRNGIGNAGAPRRLVGKRMGSAAAVRRPGACGRPPWPGPARPPLHPPGWEENAAVCAVAPLPTPFSRAPIKLKAPEGKNGRQIHRCSRMGVRAERYFLKKIGTA